jgi:signal transduction histidine kinase
MTRDTSRIGFVCHELRNALGAVRNALWVLDRAAPGSPDAVRARRTMGRQVDQLARLVDDLLDVARVARGKLELRRARVDLVARVAEALEDHAALFASRGIRLVPRLGEGPVWIDADPMRISQALANLLQNAAKFTPSGGRVEVGVERAHGSATVRVRDDGAGFDPWLRDRIFQPFAQAGEGLHGRDGGLGLGLALVKAVVELHGGSVEARSEGRGRGAEFVLRLPLVP